MMLCCAASPKNRQQSHAAAPHSVDETRARGEGALMLRGKSGARRGGSSEGRSTTQQHDMAIMAHCGLEVGGWGAGHRCRGCAASETAPLAMAN